MKYAIIEDEPYSRDQLAHIVGRLRPQYTLCFTGDSIEAAIDYFSRPESHEVELVFMDIELTDGNCFEIFQHVDIHCPVVFATAYDEYAIKAFTVNAIDYLLKPVQAKHVAAALTKLEHLKESGMLAVPAYKEVCPPNPRERILTVSGDRYSYASVADVAWFISQDNYISVVLSDGTERLTTFHNLTEAGERLDNHVFFQLSRHVIASINCIDRVSRHFNQRLMVVLRAGSRSEEIIVSASRRQEFLDWMGDAF